MPVDDIPIRISAIKPSTRVPGRFSVFVNGSYFASVTDEMLAYLGLTVGREFSQSEFDELADKLADRRLRDTAYRLLSQRQHSAYELSAKLKKRGFGAREIADVLTELTGSGYIDDRKFAENWVEKRLRFKPRGSRLLALELEAKGVEHGLAYEVVREKLAETDESEIAFRLLEASAERFSGENSIDTKRRICNFLRNRGFGSDSILKALRAFRKASDASIDE